MEENPLLTVAILAGSEHHFLHRTLQSLFSQEERNFEILLLDSREPSERGEIEGVDRIETLACGSLGKQMNQALTLSKGRYLQFLFPGDELISQEMTAYLGKIALENRWPEIVYGAFLFKEPEKAPKAMTYPLHHLYKGLSPTVLPAQWFLKNALEKIGGFDGRYSFCPSFDALCALMQKRARAVYTRRVFVDCLWRKRSTIEMTNSTLETGRILYRHFGMLRAIDWLIRQDRSLLFKRFWKQIKNAFCNRT